MWLVYTSPSDPLSDARCSSNDGNDPFKYVNGNVFCSAYLWKDRRYDHSPDHLVGTANADLQLRINRSVIIT